MKTRMFHDIILALNGVGGQVFKDLINEDAVHLSLSIYPCEKTILEKLMSIAGNFKNLQNFIKKVPQFGNKPIVLDGGGVLSQGMYARALCVGLSLGLEPYRACLVTLERELVQDAHLTLAAVLARVRPFDPLLLTLNSIVDQVIVRRLHGCEILQLLHQHLDSGQDAIDAAVQSMMRSCHRVLLKQLTGWLLHGQLIDPFDEFFIEETQQTGKDIHSSMATLDSIDSMADNAGGEVAGWAGSAEYRVVGERVPCYIPASVPDKVRFIGTTVVLFTRDPRQSTLGHDSVLRRMERSLLERTGAMQASPTGLDVAALDAVVDSVRSSVTQHLFALARDEADLVGELRLIRDHLLLGRGELFMTFLRNARSALLGPVTRTSGRDLSNHLYAAVRTVHYNSEVITEKFSFKVPPKDHVSPKCDVWSVMSLDYRPPWPLHLLLTPAVVASYNTLFNFLLQVKIAEINLHNVWIDNVKVKDGRLPPSVWRLRNLLTFVVHNLQCWLQMDVIGAEFDELLTELDKMEDFEQVIHRHSLFLARISTQAFLLSKEVPNPDQPATVKRHPVNICLVGILKQCDSFCLEAGRAGQGANEARLKEISEQLDSHLAVLMDLMGLLGEKAVSLRLLLMRVDFNLYCTRGRDAITPPAIER